MQSTDQFARGQFTAVGCFWILVLLESVAISENLGVCFFSLPVRGDPTSPIGHSGQEQNTPFPPSPC